LGVRIFEGKENTAYRVIYENGSGKNYPADYISIEEHIDDYRSINVWEYLNEFARYNIIPVDDDKTVSLADKYAKMEFVSKNSLLENYLNVDTYKATYGSQSAPIFPFGCNRRQYKAVRNALDSTISIIQGPPGTGKTQTILNILANLLLDGKTMEIVSNNNSAVENVKEKLDAKGLGFLCAQLGRASNKKDFVEKQTGLFPEMDSWKLDNPKEIRQEAISLSRELQELYENQEQLALCTERLIEYKRQVERYPKKIDTRRQWPIGKLKRYLLLSNRDLERKHHLSWLTRLRLCYHRLPATDQAPDELQYLLNISRVKELEKKCNLYREYVKDADVKNRRLGDLSLLILKDHLYRKYSSKKKRKVFSVDEVYLKTRDFLYEYPVVLSTTFSATSNINPAYKFDYLIMDEASQVDIAAGALALSCAKNSVIVGDLKQLPNVVDAHTEEIVSAVFAKYGINEAYRYSTNSFLSSICSLYPKIPQTLLKEHYRCDPLIIGFCSKQFYDGELIPMKKSESEFSPIRVVKTVKGNHARGTVNHRQVDTITQEILPVLEEQFTDIGIIAPYNSQVNALRAALEVSGRSYVAATVHKFQGREDDAIILSTVDNQIQEFTDDPHLLNVAVSRAKKQFTLVVSADEQPDSNIRDLIDYIEYYQGNSEQSEISSIYDLLYKDYTQDLLDFYKTHRRVSEYDSENITYWAIKETLQDKGFAHLGVLMHYPLRHLVTPASKLSPEQRAYTSRSWTHIDFLIFDTVTHKAKLAIEVDGSQYHKSGSLQGKRDVLKDSVLESIGLPLLRLSTTGSQEKERITLALSQD
jgi:superfamily I DNA and/or RNA helicase